MVAWYDTNELWHCNELCWWLWPLKCLHCWFPTLGRGIGRSQWWHYVFCTASSLELLQPIPWKPARQLLSYESKKKGKVSPQRKIAREHIQQTHASEFWHLLKRMLKLREGKWLRRWREWPWKVPSLGE